MSPSGPFAMLDGPSPVPVLGWRGNLLQFLRDPVGYMAPLRRAHGDVVPLVRGGAGPVVARVATYGNVSFRGKIDKIDPEAQNHQFRVEARLQNPGGLLLPGLMARVKIVTFMSFWIMLQKLRKSM